MANPLDVEARLAEGRPVVDDLAEYVLACHRLGYQNPDLTARASQLRDWYDGEVGLDLRALDADCAAMAAAADAAEDAARTHLGLAAELSDAWSGEGATAAHEFARRSGQAAGSVSSALRCTADAMAALRDALWHAVDAKVTTVLAIDGRHRADRGEWLAAARTVTTGTGDVAASSELVDQRVKPFVENDVGSDFLGAMRTARSSIDAAYDAAIARTTAAPRAVFEVPAELGPIARLEAPAGVSGDRSPPPVQTVPAAAVMSAPAPAASGYGAQAAPVPAAPSWSAPVPAAPPAVDPAGLAPAPSAAPAMPSMPSAGDLGAGASPLGSGLSGFGQQLADLIGSLTGSAEQGLPDPIDPADAENAVNDEDPEDLDDSEDSDDSDDLEAPDDPEVLEEDQDDATEPDETAPGPTAVTGTETTNCDPETSAAEPTSVPIASAPQPDSPPVVQPEAVAEDAKATPCEIAADELPQVGG